ncbi:centromere protein P isoform X2 [Trichechus manatus latirostris]|uniref:Centromere protein P isoform X2 n=1 Tax=Trichechus manatus latirostris TaxID=127582 RepID=A0A2Y9RL97_TRIMA|nr:centromere protein P isoform X2 [Trichechus manatus latirostris]
MATLSHTIWPGTSIPYLDSFPIFCQFLLFSDFRSNTLSLHWRFRVPGLTKSFKNIYQSESEGLEFSKDLRRQLGHLESELSLLSTLMGINIRKHSKKTEDLSSTEMTEKNIKKVLQRHRLSGSCHMVTFQLEFQILEIQNEKNLSSVITDLNIIMEPTEYSELSEFVSRAEERRDLFMFFRSLHFFVEWCEYRKRTFKHFKEKYPDVVQLPEGAASSCMGIQSASQPGPGAGQEESYRKCSSQLPHPPGSAWN